MKFKWNTLIIALVAASFAFGCAKKADTSKPIDQVKAEAAKMDVKALESTAQAYAKEITSKKGELDKVKDQLKELSPSELLGEKAQKIKDQLSQLGTQINELSKRYDIYAKKFQQMGGDVSAIQIA